MPKAKQTYYADFETTQVNKQNRVRVYLWAMVNNSKEFKGYGIESFMRQIQRMSAKIYFHNLKFDFSYIHYYLLSHNIEYKMLEKKGQIYSVKFWKVELRDSLNLFPNMSLKDVGEVYNKRFKKTSIEDIQVDYDHEATEEQINYCINDCRVLEEAVVNYLGTLKEVLTASGAHKTCKVINRKLTNAGIAFEAFKELSNFDKLCPKTTYSEYINLSPAYKGGYVFSKPSGIIKNVHMIDNNSIYPYVYSTKPLPFGRPALFRCINELKNFKFSIVNINIRYDLKNGMIPIIGGGIGRYHTNMYKSSSDGQFENITVSSVDLNLINQFYACDVELNWGVGYETKENFFKKYCDVFIDIKSNSTGARRNAAKVLLNSPYGKTAMNGLGEVKSYYIEDDIIKSKITGYELNEDIFQYIPIAIAITAYAREILLLTALKIGFDKVLYMDTDSIKYTGGVADIAYHPNKLGMWKDEGTAQLFKTIAPKKYVYYDGSKLMYTCAGFGKKILTEKMCHNTHVSYDEAIHYMGEFDAGLELSCLQSKRVTGGRALIPVMKRIN